MNYKNIIFDLGNVLVKLDEDATMRAFEKLGMGSFKHLRENPEALQLFQAMGIGRISNQEFFDSFRRIINPNATDKQIIDATNAMLVTIPNVKKQKLISVTIWMKPKNKIWSFTCRYSLISLKIKPDFFRKKFSFQKNSGTVKISPELMTLNSGNSNTSFSVTPRKLI